ncbi:hypothetical protein TEA_013235 [Camellia sinensis var. sinensis]|uniref:MLO-like protein n=1 Tax=Camellia sinensis var. sinensis TaxID=542762 RepID=A0A4S4EU08_CAMSN|nr:hypothetical protein TEA_013235 [Camellia sinensis var. sinensis]
MEPHRTEMRSLALTPTWSVATVMTIFVVVSLLVERSIHRLSNGHEPFVSSQGLEQLHRFIFVMAITHVSYSCLTMLLAIVKTCFFRQFGNSVVRADYLTLRKAFIVNHNLTSKYDFHSYMIRSMEEEFQKIVGVSAPLWGFVVAFMLFDVKGSNLYFWIAIIPVILVLLVGTKLQHVIATLSLESAAINGSFNGTKLNPRDDLFWFKKPELLLSLIHFILFQNAFELASFFWFWWQFGYNSCFIRRHLLVYLRLILGFSGQFLCSYSTLPVYALVTQIRIANELSQALEGSSSAHLSIELERRLYAPITQLQFFKLFFGQWQFGYNSCFIRRHLLVYLRLILGFSGQFLCSYSTLPVYALVTQIRVANELSQALEGSSSAHLSIELERRLYALITQAANELNRALQGSSSSHLSIELKNSAEALMGTNYKAALIPHRIRETIHGWGKEARRRRRHGIFTDDSTIHTETSMVLSVEEDDQRLLDSPRAGAHGAATEMELQPHTIIIPSSPSPFANETSSRAGTPLLRPSASVSSTVSSKNLHLEAFTRSTSEPNRRE